MIIETLPRILMSQPHAVKVYQRCTGVDGNNIHKRCHYLSNMRVFDLQHIFNHILPKNKYQQNNCSQCKKPENKLARSTDWLKEIFIYEIFIYLWHKIFLMTETPNFFGVKRTTISYLKWPTPMTYLCTIKKNKIAYLPFRVLISFSKKKKKFVEAIPVLLLLLLRRLVLRLAASISAHLL